MKRIFETPEGHLRWGWKTAILIFGTILFGAVLVTVMTIILTVGYASQGLAREQAMEQAALASSGFAAQVIVAVLQLGFMLWLVRWLVVRIEKRKFDGPEIGLVGPHRSKYIRLGLALGMGLSMLTISIGVFAGKLEFLSSGFDLFTPTQVFATMLLAAILACASGFGEEIAFRGYLQTRIAQRYNPTVAVLLVALFFALSHPLGNVDNPLVYGATAALVGVLFGTIFVRTGSLWMGIALHAAWNYMQIAVLAVRNSADERFLGAPLFLFDNISGAAQALIEFGVIGLGLLLVVWLTRPVAVRMGADKPWTASS